MEPNSSSVRSHESTRSKSKQTESLSFANVSGSLNNTHESKNPLPIRSIPSFGTESGLTSESPEQSLSSSFANLEIEGNGTNIPDGLQFPSKLDDERTHVSSSSIRAPSIASGLALALDEKESIRPDDSASVQAAEDDDSNSGPGSGAQNSRFGSEAGVKPFHAQLREITAQRGTPFATKLEERQELPVAPQFAYWMPDEKLLEALDSTKDRLFLLQLEQQIISFVQTPGEGSFDLPPYNSFLRLLAHRLADYYKLQHFVDSTTQAVRLYKGPSVQLPTPLSAFRSETPSEIVPQVAPSLKIMRRLGADGMLADSATNTNSNSMIHSKATSEGSEHGDGLISPAESSSTKDKASQSREQREAKYKEARDRIFADWKEENDKEQSAGPSAEASRASSVTGKRKKKKNKTQDESFEDRSAFFRQQPYDPTTGQAGYFVPYMTQTTPTMVQPTYGAMYQPQYATMQQQQMIPMVSPSSAPVMYQQPINQQYVGYTIPQQQQVMGNAYFPQAQHQQNQVQYPQQFVQTQYVPVPNQMSRPGSQTSDQSWTQLSGQQQFSGYMTQQGQYPAQTSPPMQSQPPNGMQMPYPYGQLPYQPHSPNNRNAHPLPGSYNRQGYNVQARAFIPVADNHPIEGSRTSSSNGSMLQQNHPQQMQYVYQQQPQLPMAQPQYMASTNPSYGNPGQSRKHGAQQVQSSPASTISKWGTPPTLPPKPPPPSNSRLHDASMPTYQNGTYTKPSNAPQDARTH